MAVGRAPNAGVNCMNELFAKTIPLALGAMVSPTMLTAVILVLTGKVSPRARSWAFVAGGSLALLAFTLAVPWIASAMHSVSREAIAWADVILGVLLLAVAVRKVLLRNRPEKSRAPKHPATKSPHLLEYGGFGAIVVATDASSLVLYIAIMKEAVNPGPPVDARLAAVAIGFLAVMIPALVPAIIASVAPAQTDKLLVPLGAWAKKHSAAITVVICVAFGGYLLFKGIAPFLH